MAIDTSLGGTVFSVSNPAAVNIARSSTGNFLQPVGNPVFHVWKSAVPARSTVIVHDVVNFNVGNGYNNTNGYFTAPVAGVYHFKAEILVGLTVGDWRIFISCAGKQTRATIYYQNFTSLYQTLVVEAVLNLAKGDVVYVSYSGPADAVAGAYTNFSGHFVG